MSRRRSKLRWPLIGGSLAGALLMTAVTGWWFPIRELVLAKVAEEELADAADATVPGVLRKLAALGEPGRAAVVRALGSPRAVIVRSAVQSLDAELESWSRLSPEAVEPRLAELARLLASQVEALQPPAQAAARRLAMRILRWPEAGLSIDRADVILACERVLSAQPPPRVVQANQPRRGATTRVAKKRTGPRAVDRRQAKSRMSEWPRPALLPDQMAASTLSRADSSAPPSPNEIAEPARFDPRDSVPLASAEASPDQAHLEAASAASLAGGNGATEDHELDRLSTLDLFARLHDAPTVAQRAARLLERRGFTLRQIEVGKHLTSPDAHERHQWVEALPGMRGVEAKAWLLHLSRDQSLSVRRAAISLLATNRDPEVLRRLAEVAAEERDPDLRAEAALVGEGLEALSPGDAGR
jgi:hypothetical protein